MHKTKYIIAILGILCSAFGLSAKTRVSLLTALPGPAIYELEGHTALKFEDTETGGAVVVNWGVYDFNAPNFVYRFVSGQTDYLCAMNDPGLFMESYHAQGRQVVEQVLDLDSIQTAALLAAVEDNLRPENRVYRYNYVKDNCATRPLLLIEQAADRQIVQEGEDYTSFRCEMQHFHRLYPWYQFGIDLALGRRLDDPIGEREAIFAPVTLMESMAKDSIVSQTILHGEQTLEYKPTPWLLTPMALSLLILALSIAVCFCRRVVAKVFDSVLFGVFALLGCVLCFLVFISVHEATSPNLLLLWLNPLCALGAILPWAKSRKFTRSYFILNLVALIALCILAPLLGRYMNPAFWVLIAADFVRTLAHVRKNA